MKVKHHRTYHLPWSPGVSNDDRVLSTTSCFEGKQVVVTEKRDGECTSLYRDGTVHARSIEGMNHPWQDVIKAMWRSRCHDLPDDWRVVGENLYARHSIAYNHLKAWFEVFAIFDENNIALSWTETEEWCELLSLNTVPVLWKGQWDLLKMQEFSRHLDLLTQEGYVVRLEERINHDCWCHHVGKWVRKDHVQTNEHWTKTWVSNNLEA